MWYRNMAVRLGLAAVLMTAAPAAADEFSPWVKNEARNRWECQYTYQTAGGGTATNTVLSYPKGTERAGWAYFVSPEGKPWGRCATAGNPKHDPKQMYWQKLNAGGTGYEDYAGQAAGYCPTPAGGAAPVPTIPDPPA